MGILDESVEPTSILDAQSKGQYLLDLVRPVLSKTVVALVVILIGFIAGKLVGKTLQWFLHAMDINGRWKELTGTSFRVEQFLSGVLSIGFYFMTIVMALNVLGLSGIIVEVMSLGIICIILISIVLATKDFIPNYIDGFRIYKRIRPHDMIVVETVKGKVEELTWTDVKVIAENGDTFYVPNNVFLKKGFKKLK
ncbi:mechanosensitive ion channel family protein [Candidatus Woesearchaeota archaeon]|nr:mechanosensitive ion channel family protein [Candidatus Woesearchaeota archaeon]